MTEKDSKAQDRLGRLTDILVEDALALSDVELLAEAAEEQENVDAVVTRVRPAPSCRPP